LYVLLLGKFANIFYFIFAILEFNLNFSIKFIEITEIFRITSVRL